ncbi:MAG TPA: hypothetical protein VGG85_09620 [Terracidiphilus sp.]|jgi:hypothetical protein
MDYKGIIQGIDEQITRLEKVKKLLSLNRSGGVGTKKATPEPKKRTMSPEARKRIADAQRKRWATARQKALAPTKSTNKVAKKVSAVKVKKASPKKAVKRTVSPEARKRMADAQHRRWAAFKKPKSAVLSNSGKKTTNAAQAVAVPEASISEALS